MSIRVPSSVLGIFVLSLAAISSGQVPPKSKPVTPPDLAVMHFDLTVRCSVARSRPRSDAEWATLVEAVGLRRKSANEAVWSVTTGAGELRALSYIHEATVNIAIMFFPASPEKVPDPILAYWLKDARFTRLDLDKMEIGLAGVESLPGGGTRTRSVTVTLGGGRLEANRTEIEWAEK